VVVSLDGTDIPLNHKIFNSTGLFSLIATSETGGRYLDKAFTKPHLVFGPFTGAEEADAARTNAARINAEALRASLMERPDVPHILVTGRGAAPDSAVLLAILRNMGVERLCIEAPSYMWHLLQNKALDEIFINYSLLFAGGTAALGSGQPFSSTSHPHTELLMLGLHKQNFIFTRQRLCYE
jgi:riboflavin biosynthesis pyrimidine reductase